MPLATQATRSPSFAQSFEQDAKQKGDRKITGRNLGKGASRPQISRGHFFLPPFFFRVTLDGLSESGATCNLTQVWSIYNLYEMFTVLTNFVFYLQYNQHTVEVHKHTKQEFGQYPAISTSLAWTIIHLCVSLLEQQFHSLPAVLGFLDILDALKQTSCGSTCIP